MSTSPIVRMGTNIVATLLLLVPALWNRFPLLEWDTGGYLARWFEGYLVIARSTTYGLFLAAGAPLEFWPIVVLQAAAAVWIIGLLLRIHRFDVYPFGLPAIVAGLAATTALPWIASELLTDIFAGLAVLALHALVIYRDRLSARECVAVVLFIGFATSTHSATFAVVLALCAVGLICFWLKIRLIQRAGLVQGVVGLVLGAAMLLAGNFIVAKQIAWTPGGYEIAFGRMLQDGIVTRYLDDHCPDPPLRLCAYRNSLPLDADEFFWGHSVFDQLGRFAGLGDEMRAIVLGSLRDYPGMQIETALVATAKQLIYIGTGEGIVPYTFHTIGIIERYIPSIAPAVHSARQQQGELSFKAINSIHEPIAWMAMALLPAIIFLGFRNSAFADLGTLAATIALSLLANAAVCGIISDPHDRYGSRIVWIAAFAASLVSWRVVVLVRKRQITPLSTVSTAKP